jgi:hypothetical protein
MANDALVVAGDKRNPLATRRSQPVDEVSLDGLGERCLEDRSNCRRIC